MTSTGNSVPLAVAGVFAFTSLVAVHAPSDKAASLPTTIVHTGVVTAADRAQVLERVFIVPPGTNRVDIDFSYSRGEAPVELDLGVRGPSGLRGWSEDRVDHIHIDAASASYGYLPGPIEPGEWAVLIGVAGVPDTATPYRTSIRLSSKPDQPRPVLQTRAGWYAGDLHTHSGHSDGYHTTAEGVRLPVPVQDVVTAAVRSRLHFLAISDHNTTSHWIDVDRTQAAEQHVLLVHSSEVTTYQGHFNATGARRLSDFRLSFHRPMRVLLGEAASDGAFLSINHPSTPDDEWCMGCAWAHLDPDTIGGVQGVEIANGPTLGKNVSGWQLWAELLNAGHRLVAVGGSDAHDPAASDRRVGKPATVVYASALSEDAIVEGLKSGRVYIRTEGVDGPSIDLHGTAGERNVVMGQGLPAGSLRLTAHVAHALGQDFVWIRQGREVRVTRLDSDPADVILDTGAMAGDWFSFIVRSGRRPTAIGNAIYIDR
jgi:hypothetical protein